MHSGPIAERHKPQGGKNMDNKAIAIVAVVAVAILAVAAFAIASPGGHTDDSQYVVYDGNGGKTTGGDTIVRSTDETAAGLNLFVRAGYECTGWNTAKDGSGTYYGPNANVMKGTKLYAQWEPVVTGSKLIVQTMNMYSDKFNFTLEYGSSTIPGVNLDKVGEYKLHEGARICITPTGSAVIGIIAEKEIITITFADNTVYRIAPIMEQGGKITKLDANGTSAFIEFSFSQDVNPAFSYIISVSHL